MNKKRLFDLHRVELPTSWRIFLENKLFYGSILTSSPAAVSTIATHLEDLKISADYYDKIVTGDLGAVGSEILIDLLKAQGHDISKQHMDCGLTIYDTKFQDVHSGGSGCGCAAVTLAGYLLQNMREGKWKRILFVPTGALLSSVSANEGDTVPGIAHAVALEWKGE